MEEAGEIDSRGYVCLSRQWESGTTIEIAFEMKPEIVNDALGNAACVAVIRGPLVFVLDVASLPRGRLQEDIAVELRSDSESVEMRSCQRRSARKRLEIRTAWLVPQEPSSLRRPWPLS